MSRVAQEYILPVTLPELSFTELLRHSAEITDTSKRDFFEIIPESITVDAGLFTHSTPARNFPSVSVIQTTNALVLTCPCKTIKNNLCNHQIQVLLNMLDKPWLRIFFDPALRQKEMLQVARIYGLENEPELERFFQLSYTDRAFHIQPIQKELVSPDEVAALLSVKPVGGKSPVRRQVMSKEFPSDCILIFRKRKYFDDLQIALFKTERTKAGKIKNPLIPVEPLDQVWSTENIEEARFYTAISKFQHQLDTTSASDLEGLKMVIKNPLNLEVYLHESILSDSLSANALTPVNLALNDTEITLSVFKKDPFYEITGQLKIGEKQVLLKNLKIKYQTFILFEDRLILIDNPDALRIIDFFKKNNEKIIIHKSKYDIFRKDILGQLEAQVKINYTYIKPATKRQLTARDYDLNVERLVYLSDGDHYVYLCPVMRYGGVEVPVMSRKQIIDRDQNGNEFQVTRDEAAEIRFMSILLRQHPDFHEQLGWSHDLSLLKSAFLDENWFLKAFEEWRNAGIHIFGFKELTKNRLNGHMAKISVSVNSGLDWFNTELKVEFGKQKASLKQIQKAVKNRNRYIPLDDGTTGILPEAWMEKFAEYFNNGLVVDDLLKIPKTNFETLTELFEQEMLAAGVQDEIIDFKHIFSKAPETSLVTAPDGLKTALRDYQLHGLQWLSMLDDFNFGACLADDMGLGKTIQIIAFILVQQEKHPGGINLVVVPTSLLFNWQAEVKKFAPGLRLFTHYGPERSKDGSSFKCCDIVLTTYGMMVSDILFLKKFQFNLAILDESQAIKNPESQRYKSARMIQARNRIVLTGTPVENNTFDIYGQLSFTCPGLLGSKQYFKQVYSSPIDKFQNNRRADELRKKIKPFILRRTKKEVAKELPEKTEMVIYCEMGAEQREIYDACEKELRDYLLAKKDEDFAKESMHVLTGLTKLRQICNSPALLKDEAFAGDYSAKIDVLLEQITERSSEHKILIFSQFVSMLELIKKELEKRELPFEYLTGQTKNRSGAVRNFQENSDVRIFLISLKAGGTGLNLTEADYVYLVDPWWNPAVENQAIDRSYRIGQDKHVIAVRLICPDTVEEKIMRLQASKLKLGNDLIQTDAGVLKSLSRGDLMEMLRGGG